MNVSHDLVRYANCWEDADILCAALRPERGGRFLSIASGGDNSFALLAAGADEVVAADLNAAQLAVVELKMAAIRRLERDDTLAFLGISRSGHRLSTYRNLAADLSPSARAYWDAHPELIESGVIHQGKFERYFGLFRRWVLPLVHGQRTVRSLMTERDVDGRRVFHDRQWDTWRWRQVFHLFFSRFVMGRLGRDPELFRYVDGRVSTRILARARHALRELPAHDNPYLEYILTGTFTTNLPRYLEPEPYAVLRERLDRLILVHAPIDQAGKRYAGARGFDGFNLSDIFEYLDLATCERLYRDLLEVSRTGARFAYWNMLAPRACPENLLDHVDPLPLGDRLFARDRAFFYSAFRVEEVR
ncbi:MAG: DUF3419 family protein [Acidobacteriota bacterium]